MHLERAPHVHIPNDEHTVVLVVVCQAHECIEQFHVHVPQLKLCVCVIVCVCAHRMQPFQGRACEAYVTSLLSQSSVLVNQCRLFVHNGPISVCRQSDFLYARRLGCHRRAGHATAAHVI
jgi:hypothetical protein